MAAPVMYLGMRLYAGKDLTQSKALVRLLLILASHRATAGACVSVCLPPHSLMLLHVSRGM